jgi:hypothetical protein
LYGYSLCILDPEGDYASLQVLPGVTVLGGADPLPRPRELVRAVRHADTSIVIDFSHVSFDEKRAYIRTMLPALATLRRQTGLPHRIVLDEAHYFLAGADARDFLDFDLGGYTLTTYRASRLHQDVLASAQAIVVTRESDPAEVRLLYELCRSCQGRRLEDEWVHMFGALSVGKAVALPLTEEAERDVRRITLAPRLTPHVRHQTKYVDIPVFDNRAFVFAPNGVGPPVRVHTLKEFVTVVEQTEITRLDGYLRRSDFSRWITDVFGDYPLGKTVRQMEDQYRKGTRPDVVRGITQAIRARYDFPPVVGAPRADATASTERG